MPRATSRSGTVRAAWSSCSPQRDDAGSQGRLDHLAFAVPDGDTLRAWADALSQAGIDHAGVVDELGKPSLQLRDPDGIAIELVAPPPLVGAPRGVSSGVERRGRSTPARPS